MCSCAPTGPTPVGGATPGGDGSGASYESFVTAQLEILPLGRRMHCLHRSNQGTPKQPPKTMTWDFCKGVLVTLLAFFNSSTYFSMKIRKLATCVEASELASAL